MVDLRRATLGWYRAVLAPNLFGAIITFLLLGVLVLSLTLHYLVFARWAQQLLDYSPALQWASLSVSLLAGGYGLQRGLAFHPALDFRYHEWLKASPWSPGAPLPKGPLTPVWQDGVFLSLATLISIWHADLTPNPVMSALGPTIGMGAGLALSWTVANFVTRNLVAVYAAAFTAPTVALLVQLLPDSGGTGIAVGLVAAAGVAYVGVRFGLQGYPWQVFPRDKNYLKRLTNPYEERSFNWQPTATVGWPYTQLLQPPRETRVSRRRALAEAAIVAAWAACVGSMVPDAMKPGMWVVLLYLGTFLCGAKLFGNVLVMCPKLCLGERVAKRRPIIWRHDRTLLEPLLVGLGMAAVAGVGWLLLKSSPPAAQTHLHAPATAAAAAVGIWLVRRLGQPVAKRFYTGPQMIRGVKPNQAFFKPLAAPGE